MNGRFPVAWRESAGPVAYPEAVARMERDVAAIASGAGRETVWLLEHPPLYTAGTSARARDLLDPGRLPVHAAGRGGEYTYHGPGQRVAYAMLDLGRRGRDLRRYVHGLEDWIIAALAELGVAGERRAGRVGVWIDQSRRGGAPGREDKIAAVGIRVRRWVAYHGVSLNVCPDLAHYDGIVPCGVAGHGVTSLAALGVAATMADADAALRAAFARVFDSTLIPSEA